MRFVSSDGSKLVERRSWVGGGRQAPSVQPRYELLQAADLPILHRDLLTVIAVNKAASLRVARPRAKAELPEVKGISV